MAVAEPNRDKTIVAGMTVSGAIETGAQVRVPGHIHKGDRIKIRTEDGAVLGRGLAAYDSDEVSRIAGRKSAEILSVLGYKYADEVIHRDDMVMG